MTVDTAQVADPEQLRRELVASLAEQGAIKSEAVEGAMSSIFRHWFVPEADLKTSYTNDAIDILDSNGERISIASQPAAIAEMLEQDEIQPGHRILEIGAGTGYNAALLATLTGPEGHVTTIDIHPDLVARTKVAIEKSGIRNVEAVLVDGDEGVPRNAPYDRIIATVGSWDLSPAWFEQLAEGGRLIIPLRIRGYSQTVVTFERQGDRFVSINTNLSIYMPMRGVAGYGRHTFDLDESGSVRLALHTEQSATPGLAEALSGPRSTAWTGVSFESGTPFTGMEMWLAANFETFSQLHAGPEAVDKGLIVSAQRWGNMAAYTDDTVAYLHFRQSEDEGDGVVNYEVGVTAHGPSASDFANQVSRQVQTWNEHHRGEEPVFTAYPGANALAAAPNSFLLHRPRTPFTMNWSSNSQR